MSAAEKGGRDDKGRFTRGNPGGSGNPFARQVAALRSALVHKVTPEDIEDIVIILLLKAKQGDLAAVKLLFTYVLGKPTETVDPDRLDEMEWEQFKRNVVPGNDLPAVVGACHAELANGMARVTIPPVQASIARQMADVLAVSLPVPLDPHTQAQLDHFGEAPCKDDEQDDHEQEPTPAVLPARPAAVAKPSQRLDRAANPRQPRRAAQRRHPQESAAAPTPQASRPGPRASAPAVGKRSGRPGASISDSPDGKQP